MTNKIVDIHQMSRRFYGSPRIHAELVLGEGIRCSRKRVERLFAQADIVGIHRRNRGGCTRRDPAAEPSDDLVNRACSESADSTGIHLTRRRPLRVVRRPRRICPRAHDNGEQWSLTGTGGQQEPREPGDSLSTALPPGRAILFASRGSWVRVPSSPPHLPAPCRDRPSLRSAFDHTQSVAFRYAQERRLLGGRQEW